jgi:hypothetical protein
MHINLNKANTEKFLPWASKAGCSVGELVNLYLEAMEEIEVKRKVTVTVKPEPESPPKTFTKQSGWVNRW